MLDQIGIVLIIYVLLLIFKKVVFYLYNVLLIIMVLVCMGGDYRGDGWVGGGLFNCLGLIRRVVVIYMFVVQDVYIVKIEDFEV